MDKLKVGKVDSVLLQRGRDCRRGTLHLTQHHLIFVPDQSTASTSSSSAQASSSESKEEVWFSYSLLWLVTRLPSILPLDSTGNLGRSTSRRIYPLLLRLRNFESAALGFQAENSATDVFESVKGCVIAASPDNLYAFVYKPSEPLPLSPKGWHIYDPKAEFERQGVGTRTKAWRFCDVNAHYGFCSTYPANLCVPSRISDTVIRHASKYRSKERIPALSYLHWANLASITRSSQPLVGLNNRSMQDEKLIEAIFTSHLFADPESPTAQAALAAGRNNTSTGNTATDRGNIIAIYGATTTNLIIDARPTTNAMANRAKGAGTENMEHYKGCKKVYLGVDNIHVMRDSLQRVTNALRASESPWTFGLSEAAAALGGAEGNPQLAVLSEDDAPPLDHNALKRSGWLKHISALLEGCSIIARNIHVNNSHVLIHCSDGWDRTSQLAALAEICLDPYYRTMQGFAVLVEKEWCSFGHRFWDRCGHASSEKYFQTAQGYGEEINDEDSGEEPSGGFEPQAAAQAFWGFTKQLTANFQGDNHSGNGKGGAHLKEISPVFHQFLDCIWQIMRQFPARFEYNEAWLLDIYDGVYECKYGTFLYNCEGERNGLSELGRRQPASSRSYSIWDYLLDDDRRTRYLNNSYDKSLDTDTKRPGADMGVLLPKSRDVGFWAGVFRRDAVEMNKLVQAEAEERRRQLEVLERQRQLDEEADDSHFDGTTVVGPNDVEGVQVGPVVSRGQDDPVLRNGVVDLSRSERQDPLPYQPYQPRQYRGPPAAVGRVEGRVSPLPSSTPAATKSSSNVPTKEDPLASSAQEAAAKMKNLFLGWGARFQDAYLNATAGDDEEPSSPKPLSSAGGLVTKTKGEDDYLDYRRSASNGRHGGSIAHSSGALGHIPPVSTARSTFLTGEANPWASSAEQDPALRSNEMPTELSSASQQTSPAKTSSPSTAGGVTKTRESKKQPVTDAPYDPLGVGLLP